MASPSSEMDIVALINSRKAILKDICSSQVHGCLQTHSTLMSSIGYSYELKDHKGCVNCLQWNDEGSLLASGSDDLDIKVWSIHERRLAASMNSGHTGNIFSVKFMPFSGDLNVASGAEDREVHLHDLTMFTTTKIWSCSSGRVKRLSVSKQFPHLIWSASEDGCIRQYDIRENHTCSSEGRCRNVLIDLKKTCGLNSNCKCIDVNPVRHEQIAVGAYDPYVRLYDTRILSLSCPSTETIDKPDLGCLAHFSPGHISQSFRKLKNNNQSSTSTVACTYVSFSPHGDELLANLSSEQVYLFNTVSFQPVLTYTLHDSDPMLFHKPSYCPTARRRNLPFNESNMDERVIYLRDRGNELFKASKYTQAIECYSIAISLNTLWYVLYSNRATAHMKRNWCGDIYDALKDTERALVLCPLHQKSLQRRIKCFKLLGWVKEGLWYVEKFAQLFPEEKDYLAKTNEELKNLDDEGHRNGYHGTNGSSVHWEQAQQQNAYDYCKRFVGHCNTHTDIKEATFLGQNGDYIGAGSDDGNAFIWDKKSGKVVKILSADESIVNCVQWNPKSCVLATSGIESVIKLWEPCGSLSQSDCRAVEDVYKACELNQSRMKLDPFEIMLMRLGLRVGQSFANAMEEVESEDQQPASRNHPQCRQS